MRGHLDGGGGAGFAAMIAAAIINTKVNTAIEIFFMVIRLL
jgi:hypothetical protein